MKLLCVYILAFAVFAVSGCKKAETPKEGTQKAVDVSVSRKLATVSPEFLSPEMERMRQLNHDTETVVFAHSGAGLAYIEPVKDKFRVVHNGKPGKPYTAISELKISRDGMRVAYVGTQDKNSYVTVIDGRKGYPFGVDSNHWFTPDGKKYISTLEKDGKKYIVIEKKVYDKYDVFRSPVIRNDSGAIAFTARNFVSNAFQFVITDMDMKNETVFDSCGQFILPSEDRSMLAVGCKKDGADIIKTIDFHKRNVVSESKVDGVITHMRFAPDNSSLPYTVIRQDVDRYIVWNGRKEKLPKGEEFLSDPVVLHEPDRIGVIAGDVYRARLYFAFQEEKKKEGVYGYISELVTSKDGLHHAYIGTKQNEQQMQVVVDGHEGPKFDKIVSPVFSPDGSVLVYRARQSGMRFVVVSDLKGKIIRKHLEYEKVYPVEFTEDGGSIAYGVLDGNELWWKVEKLK